MWFVACTYERSVNRCPVPRPSGTQRQLIRTICESARHSCLGLWGYYARVCLIAPLMMQANVRRSIHTRHCASIGPQATHRPIICWLTEGHTTLQRLELDRRLIFLRIWELNPQLMVYVCTGMSNNAVSENSTDKACSELNRIFSSPTNSTWWISVRLSVLSQLSHHHHHRHRHCHRQVYLLKDNNNIIAIKAMQYNVM